MLGEVGDRLLVLFVTMDTGRGTRELLRAYVAALDPGFIGLYGERDQTARTARDFKVFYAKVPTGSSYAMDHSTISYVYDEAGHLRLGLRHAQTPEECVADIRQLLQRR